MDPAGSGPDLTADGDERRGRQGSGEFEGGAVGHGSSWCWVRLNTCDGAHRVAVVAGTREAGVEQCVDGQQR